MKLKLNSIATLLGAGLLIAGSANAQWSLTGNAGTTPGTNYIGTSDAKNLQVKTNNATRMTITSAGKVGVGVTSPKARLEVGANAAGSVTPALRVYQNNCGGACGQVNGAAIQVINSNTSGPQNGACISFADPINVTNNDDGAASINLISRNSANGYGGLGFSTRNSTGLAERVRIDTSGNVGIGTSSFSSADKLTLFDAANANTTIKISNTTNGFTNSGGITLKNFASYDRALQFTNYNTSAAAMTIAYNFLSSSNFEILSLLNGGNVGIGTNSPFYNLEVNGTAGKPGGGSWTTTSDARLKQNINQYNDGLAQILKINPVKYHYNQMSGYDVKPEYVGVLAQELKDIAPYMVGTFTKEGKEYYNVDNSAMTYMLINAVKELNARLEDVKNENANLKACVESLCNNSSSSKVGTTEINNSSLFQNQPNPFNQSTVIRYALSSETANGKIIIRDLNGNLVKQVSIAESGKGQVTINANQLAQGTYTYTLEVADASVDTKLMVITK